MILELDCGNSFLKWRLFSGDGRCILPVHVADGLEALRAQLQQSRASVSFVRMVSVRADEETEEISAAISRLLDCPVALALPSMELAGVSNGYLDYQRLGMDRWLAIVAAYNVAREACLVIDLGTAVTVDWIDAEGRHLGGYICPGIPSLRQQLQSHTQRIRYDPGHGGSLGDLSPGRSTAEAVERGCLLMLRAYIESQVARAVQVLGKDAAIYVTGGDGALVDGLASVRHVPDLVFRGLALACPVEV
ncbi:type III pantothenate kinase [Stutzerimonas kirkiae]|uniref:Type III pantothenate kinase n=1 Tax=Stutzerimonas kirkiae TaxID=2211392 RepID=A0A4Q9QV16_9GAMM|nr:type III pantothenate kinase [Stutzerimonas kirkiae]TBU87503.1 pantothenate kinase [Stutzerimonas kirkiae]TBU97857.1 pantothenate kinase [Stutzerimonas kirkiae]TBV08787.1 pantothenate kinase [Stutzerimonas kirkiae]TBV11429.1 pantothenate kinase [Stutzerimonas kirkiae]